MAATKTRSVKQADEVENVEDSRGTETTESTEATEPKQKRTIRRPTTMFQVLDELPDNPKRGRPEGLGTSKFVGLLKNFVDNAPEGKWVQVMDYVNASGARLAQKNLEKHPEYFPDGVKFEVEVRRYDVPVGDGGVERHSGLMLKWGE